MTANLNVNFLLKIKDLAWLYQYASEAEAHVYAKPRTSLIYSRATLERAVRWIYKIDGSLSLISKSRKTLGELVYHSQFKRVIPDTILPTIELIIKTGNSAVHEDLPISEEESLTVFQHLFLFINWLQNNYGAHPIKGINFNQRLVPINSKQAESQQDLELLEKTLSEKDAIIKKYEHEKKGLLVQINELSGTRRTSFHIPPELESRTLQLQHQLALYDFKVQEMERLSRQSQDDIKQLQTELKRMRSWRLAGIVLVGVLLLALLGRLGWNRDSTLSTPPSADVVKVPVIVEKNTSVIRDGEKLIKNSPAPIEVSLSPQSSINQSTSEQPTSTNQSMTTATPKGQPVSQQQQQQQQSTQSLPMASSQPTNSPNRAADQSDLRTLTVPTIETSSKPTSVVVTADSLRAEAEARLNSESIKKNQELLLNQRELNQLVGYYKKTKDIKNGIHYDTMFIFEENGKWLAELVRDSYDETLSIQPSTMKVSGNQLIFSQSFDITKQPNEKLLVSYAYYNTVYDAEFQRIPVSGVQPQFLERYKKRLTNLPGLLEQINKNLATQQTLVTNNIGVCQASCRRPHTYIG